MSKQTKVNEMLCPLCGKPNQCMAHSETPCWCNQVTIPEALIAIVPQQTKGKACICQSCIQLEKSIEATAK